MERLHAKRLRAYRAQMRMWSAWTLYSVGNAEQEKSTFTAYREHTLRAHGKAKHARQVCTQAAPIHDAQNANRKLESGFIMEICLEASYWIQRLDNAEEDNPRGHRALPRCKWRHRQPTLVSRRYVGTSL